MVNEVFKVRDHFLENSSITTHVIGYEENELHSHDFIEFFYILKGDCNHNYNGTFVHLQAGDAYLLVPKDKHQFLESENVKQLLHRDIIFTTDFFKKVCDSYNDTLYEDILNKVYKLNFQLSSEEISKIEAMIPNLIVNLSEKQYILTAKVIAKLIINLIIEKNMTLTNTYPDWLIQIINITSSSHIETISLSKFIETLPYSYSYICHKFKEYIGTTMTDYYNHQKIKYAYSLLKTTNYSIDEVCNKIGFNNISHFYNLFKKYYKTTPNKIRKNT